MYDFDVQGSGNIDISNSAQVSGEFQVIFQSPGRVTIGDYCVIGPGVKLICAGGDVTIGDWSTLHDRCLVLSGKGVQIGAHCWFGQNSIIDGTGGITIGRGVRVGMYSQLWSHVAAGEQIEGCTLIGERPVVLEDDVWLVGSCIVASGVTIGRRSVALIGSNITKSFGSNSVLAGSPAILKSNLSFYRDIALDEKWELLVGWLKEIAMNIGCDNEVNNTIGVFTLRLNPHSKDELIIFAKNAVTANTYRVQYPEATVCCVEDKTYNKRLSEIERKVLKPLSGNKARFNTIK
jgi:acetyltransferase-like isoleucine patch superfamily enzyme